MARRLWIGGSDTLRLHDLYRAMAWLGEPLGEAAPEALAPGCVTDLVEEDLFTRRRDLFGELTVAFTDTTSWRSASPHFSYRCDFWAAMSQGCD